MNELVVVEVFLCYDRNYYKKAHLAINSLPRYEERQFVEESVCLVRFRDIQDWVY